MITTTPLNKLSLLILYLNAVWSIGIGFRLTYELSKGNFLIISHPFFNALDWHTLLLLGILSLIAIFYHIHYNQKLYIP